jgi:predicted nuclease with RNAse H fold
MLKKIVGIDYGAKLAGTTVAAWNENGSLHWKCSGKKQDADKWLEEKLLQLRPDLIFMDAPLSLPGVYSGQGTDYFYREGDRALGAMSPMFLGGLTARAMQLKANLTEEGFQILKPTLQGWYNKSIISMSYTTKKTCPLYLISIICYKLFFL